MSSNIPTTNALHAISGRRRCGASAARAGGGAVAGADEPGTDRDEDADDERDPARSGERLRDDLPRVVDRRPHRIGGDELIDDVLSGEPTHDEHDQRRRRRDRCRASEPPAGGAHGPARWRRPRRRRAKIQTKFAICSSQWVSFWAVSRLSASRIVTCPASGGIWSARSVTNPNRSPSLRTSGRMSRTTSPFDVSTAFVSPCRTLTNCCLREHGELRRTRPGCAAGRGGSAPPCPRSPGRGRRSGSRAPGGSSAAWPRASP